MRCIAAILLSSVLAAPVTSMAAVRQDHDERKEERKEAKHERRFYDRAHHDYHVWDSREDELYRQYAEEHHLRGRDYERLSAKQRRAYWKWRHERERDRDRR